MNQNTKSTIKWIIKFVITAGLFVLLFRPETFGFSRKFINVELADVIEEIRSLRLATFVPWIIAAFIIKGTGMLASMRRWDLLLRGQGIVAPFRHLMGSFLVGRFFGAFLPSTIGLDFYRTYDLARHSKLVAANVAVVFVEKIIGLFALSLLLFFTAPFGVQFVGGRAVAGLLAVFAIPVTLSFMVLLFPGAIVWLLDRSFLRIEVLERRLRSAVEAVAAYRDQRGLLLRAVGYGLVVHTATALMYYATARSIAAEVHFSEIIFVAPIMIAATVGVPLSMGGEGIREGTFVYLLGLVGVASASAFVLSHLGFWVGEIISLAGGVIYILRPAGYRPELSGRAVEDRKTRGESLPAPAVARGFWRVENTTVGTALRDAWRLSLLAGFAVALCESLLILLAYGDPDWGVLWFSVLTYGLAGVAAGFGMSTCLVVMGRWERTFQDCLPTIAATSVFGFFALVIARFRIRRDVFGEHAMGKMGLLTDLGLVCIAGLLILVVGIGLSKRWWTVGSCRCRRVTTVLIAVVLILAAFSYVATPHDSRQVVHDLPDSNPAVITSRDTPNILLVVVDTLRRDALGCYGAEGNPTPNLDTFSESAIRYDRALAQCSWTRPSFATIFSGRYPSSHTAKYKFSSLPDEVTTLAETLQAAGYQTLGIANNTNIAPAFNYQQGFDTYVYLAPDPFFGASTSASRLVIYQVMRKFHAKFGVAVPDVNYFYRNAESVNEAALEAMQALDGSRPSFVFVHYMDPHDPYMPHPNDGTGVARARTPKPSADQAQRLKGLYDGEVRYLDEQLDSFLRSVEATDISENLVTVVTSDHGEEFYEHDGWWHGTTLYEEAIAVPLMIRLPNNQRAGEAVWELSQLLDIAPTLISLSGTEIPEGMQGRNLLAPNLEPLSYAFSEEDHEGNILYALRGDRWKLIEANERNRRGLDPQEFYDLDVDPGELRDLSEDEPLTPVLSRFHDELALSKEAAAEGAVVGASTTIDDEVKQQLEAIGYF